MFSGYMSAVCEPNRALLYIVKAVPETRIPRDQRGFEARGDVDPSQRYHRLR